MYIPYGTCSYRLNYHYTHAHDQHEKELFYKLKSAEKVLALGYFDDLHGYLESAVPLSTDLATLLHIKSLVDAAISTIAVSGPRSPRHHRRPSLDNLIPTEDSVPPDTPRKLETLAQIPVKVEQLRVKVAALIEKYDVAEKEA